MNWNSWSDFFAMGGYALYVWGSVLMVAFVLAGEVVALRMRRHALMKMHGRWVRNARKESNESAS